MKIIKKIILVLIFFLLLLTAVCLYLNYHFLPVQVKNKAVSELEKLTNKKISLEKLSYIPIKGFILTNLKISSDAPDATDRQNEDFISAGEISFNIALIDLIKKKTIAIPSLNIDELYLRLERSKDNKWNIIEFISGLKKSKTFSVPGKSSKYSFFLDTININNSTIDFTDNSLKKPFRKKITRLNIDSNLSLAALSADFKVTGITGESEHLKIEGQYKTLSKNLDLELQIKRLDLNSYISAYAFKIPLSTGRPRADLDATVKMNLDKDKKISATAVSTFKDCHLNWQGYQLQGDINVTANMRNKWPLSAGFNYEIKTTLKQNLFSLPKRLGLPDSIVSGLVVLVPDSLKLVQSQITWPAVPVSLTGELKDFKNPCLNLSAKTDADLSDILKVLPKNLSGKISQFIPAGKSRTEIKVEGYLKNKIPLSVSGGVDLENCLLKHPALPLPLENIKGHLDLDKKSVKTSKLNFLYNKSVYKLDLACDNLSQPVFAIDLTSDLFKLETAIKPGKDSTAVPNFNCRFYDSLILANGTLRPVNNPSSLILDIKGNISLVMADLEKICKKTGIKTPLFIQQLKNYPLESRLDSGFQFKGPWHNKAEWQIKAEPRLPLLKIKDYTFEKISCPLTLQKNVLTVDKFEAVSYNGLLQGKASIDFNPENFVYEASLQLSGLDLHRLTESSKLKGKNIYGLVDGQLQINGFGKDLRTLQGKGFVSGKEGRLEIPALESIASFMKLPFLGKFTFNSAEGQFRIANKTVIIPKIELLGPEADLIGEGTIGFDLNTDLNVEIHILKSVYEQNRITELLGKIVMSPLGKYLSKVKVTGHINAPKISWIDIPNTIQKIFKGDIKNTVKDLLDILVE